MSAAAANEGMSRVSGKPPDARKKQGRTLPYRFQREHGPTDTLISDF